MEESNETPLEGGWDVDNLPEMASSLESKALMEVKA